MCRRRQTRPSCNLARAFKKKKQRRNECRRRRQNGTEPCDAMRREGDCGWKSPTKADSRCSDHTDDSTYAYFPATAALGCLRTQRTRGQASMLIRSCRACWHEKQKRTCRTHLHEHDMSTHPPCRVTDPRGRRRLGLWGKKRVRRPRRPAPSRRGRRIVSSGASAKLSHEVPQRQQHLIVPRLPRVRRPVPPSAWRIRRREGTALLLSLST